VLTQCGLLQGLSLAVAVSRRPLARVRPQFSPFEIYGGQRDTVTGFSPSTSVFPC
jgi:hypothetical protein